MRNVEWTEGVLHVQVAGPIVKNSFIAAARRLTADPRYLGLDSFVADFLDAKGSDARLLEVFEDLLALLLGAACLNRNLRIAVVAQDPYIVQLADALVAFSSDDLLQITIFTDRAAAAAWMSARPRPSRPSMRFRPR